MRFHLVSLPHTQTTADYSVCAYTQKVRGFCRMMIDQGHEVYLYAGDENDAPCTEHGSCISEDARAKVAGDNYVAASFDWRKPHWQTFNRNAVEAIKARRQPRDFLCLIAGHAHKPVADALPDMLTVEWGVGYGGFFSNFRVFESYAWMHTCYGARGGSDPHAVDGRWFDAVIPGYLDPAEFPARKRKGDYLLYVGRLIERKGVHVAVEVAKRTGKKLVVAGPGVPPDGCEYVGVVGPKERGALMAGATAVLMPTIYIEPFGNVGIEAMACGTPVISSPWGAMTETVRHGVTGYHCHTLHEFCEAVEKAPSLKPATIRKHVRETYAMRVIGKKFDEHFRRLATLHERGWYSEGTR